MRAHIRLFSDFAIVTVRDAEGKEISVRRYEHSDTIAAIYKNIAEVDYSKQQQPESDTV